MAGVLTYDPKLVSIIYDGIIIEGFAAGTFLTIERMADMWVLKMSTDGIGTRAKSNNRSATATLTLLASSQSNDKLSAAALADENSNSGAGPFLVKDGTGTTIVSAPTAWVPKMAPIEFAAEVPDRVWTIVSDNMQIFAGGSAAAA